VNTDAKPAVTDEVRELARDAGAAQPAGAAMGDAEGAALIGRFGARSRLRTGQTAEVAVDVDGLHFFDPSSGMGIYDGTTEEGT
jgi:multiple sugar transport system ATP-binding protein